MGDFVLKLRKRLSVSKLECGLTSLSGGQPISSLGGAAAFPITPSDQWALIQAISTPVTMDMGPERGWGGAAGGGAGTCRCVPSSASAARAGTSHA